jgi:hypothetical protein
MEADRLEQEWARWDQREWAAGELHAGLAEEEAACMARIRAAETEETARLDRRAPRARTHPARQRSPLFPILSIGSSRSSPSGAARATLSADPAPRRSCEAEATVLLPEFLRSMPHVREAGAMGRRRCPL